MKKLVLINNVTYIPGVNEIGDIVQVCEENQPLQAKMLEKFDIIIVPEVAIPEVKKNYLFKSTTTEWTLDQPENKKVWDDNGVWKEVIQEPKYKLNYDESTGNVTENYSRLQVNKDAPTIATKIEVAIK